MAKSVFLVFFQDWISPGGAVGGLDDAVAVLPDIDGTKRKRKKSKSMSKPTLTIGLPTFGMGANPSQVCHKTRIDYLAQSTRRYSCRI